MDKLNDQNLVKLLRSRFSDKEIILYHLSKARRAGQSVKTNLSANNTVAAIADMQTVLTEVESLHRLMGGEFILDDKK